MQHVRLSQFVITYGPGAIIEGLGGPRVIPRPDIGLFESGRGMRPSDYDIADQRMSEGLLNGARIFRLPTNAELGVPADLPLYRTRSFPEWRLCHNSQAHGAGRSVLFRLRLCPQCRTVGKQIEPVRFIVACPKGHMDDADWYAIIHGDSTTCPHRNWFWWSGGGGALSRIELECPQCHAPANLGRAYGQRFRCSGRFPEREPLGSGPLYQECDGHMLIIQRQASNLRIPEIRTLFTIPPRHTELHLMLQDTSIRTTLIALERRISSKQTLESILNNLVRAHLIKQDTAHKILSYEWGEIQRAINEILTPVPRDYETLILEEFHALIRGSAEGIPPYRGPKPRSQVFLEINHHLVQRFPRPGGKVLRVAPISRLRTVIVQMGYRREVDTQVPADLVDIGFPDPLNPHQKWYPGVEFLGEGIFIMLDAGDGWHFDLEGRSADEWLRAYRNSGQYPDHVFRVKMRHELHPVFVWWHTLAHLLIRSASIYSGYSSASMRERVFIELNGSKARGGILLHATQPGSEGTFGGLIALSPHFMDILENSLDTVHSCSCDPICGGNLFRMGGYIGAACYGCLLVSETSCEHRNMWLDRNLLRDNPP
ncbi:MAG: DUF1998 domain-containing protein [Candidatus Caldarchaeum sp.]